MRLLSDRVAYADGNHNMVPRFVEWQGDQWMAFRSASTHRSPDGRIALVRSRDLDHWDEMRVVIDTPWDDRDPSIYVWGDRLFVVSLSVDREWEDGSGTSGRLRRQGCCRCLITSSEDGESWSEPVQSLPDNYVIWWPLQHQGRLYAAVQRRLPEGSSDTLGRMSRTGLKGCNRQPEFVRGIDRQSELWGSENGHAWGQVAVICDLEQASETALAPMPDGRMVAFVRHDDHDGTPGERWRPEIMVSDPPFECWKRVIRFDFPTNGPSIVLVSGALVTCSRAFFEDPRTPLNSVERTRGLRGLILGEVELEDAKWEPRLSIPHHTGFLSGVDASIGHPDISYAWMRDLGSGQFAMAYYEGHKGASSDIRMARLSL